jgi:phosphinothricin acetyltransferase
MPTITYRLATPEDASFLAELQNAFIPSGVITAQIEPYTVENRRAWLAAHTPNRRPCWIVLYNGAEAGMLSLSDFHPRAAYDITAEITLYLHPDYLYKGLGGQVLAFADEQAPKFGIENLAALIYNTNKPSLALFSKHGYQQVALMPNVARHADGYRSLIILLKTLKDKA